MGGLNLIQWNIRSIKSNYNNLINIISEFDPDIVFLNETWLKKDDKINIKYYSIERVDRFDGKGDVAFLIRDNLQYEVMSKSKKVKDTGFQSIIIKIRNIKFINVYNPPNNKLVISDIEQLFNKKDQDQVIVMGDLNAHHNLWGSFQNNSNGEKVMELIDKYDYVVLNEEISTRLVMPGSNISPLDLTLVSQNLARYCEWGRIEDCGNSDHFPTTCKVNQGNGLIRTNSHRDIKKRNYKKANWNEYHNFLASQLNNNEINFSYDDIIENMYVASDTFIPNKVIKKNGKPKNIWWDEECSAQLNIRKQALAKFKHFPNLRNFIEAKRIIASVKRFLKKKEGGF